MQRGPRRRRREHWPVSRADLDPHYDRAETDARRRSATRSTTRPTTRRRRRSRSRPPRRSASLDWFLPPLAVTFAQPGRGAGPGRADRARQRPNIHGRTRADLPARRRVRRRLQLRRQEHARLQLPDRGLARRRRDPHPLRGARVRAARGRRLDASTTSSTRREQRGPADRHAARCRGVTVTADRPRARRPARSARRTCCCATAPPSRRSSPRLGDGLLAATATCSRSRSAARRRGSTAAACRGRIEPGYGPVITSAVRVADELDGDGRRPRLLHRGRRLSRVRHLDAAGGRRSRRSLRAWRRRCSRASSTRVLRRDTRHRSSAEVSALLGDCRLPSGRAAAARYGARRPRRPDVARRRPPEVDWQQARRARAEYFDARSRDSSQDGSPSELGGDFLDNPLWLPEPGDHRPPARRLPDGAHATTRASSTRTARCSTTRACTSPTAR